MTLPANRPETETYCFTGSPNSGSTLVAASVIVPLTGYLKRVYAGYSTTVGSTTVAVTINGNTTDVCSSLFTLASQTGQAAGAFLDINEVGAGTAPGGGGYFLNAGDMITFSPSGANGSAYASFAAAIRAQK